MTFEEDLNSCAQKMDALGMNKLGEQLQSVLEDMEDGEITWQEAKRIVIADLKNERARLEKLLSESSEQ